MPAYEGQLIDEEDEEYFDDDYESCEFCGDDHCVCGDALDCRCGAYQVGPNGGFYQIADCYC